MLNSEAIVIKLVHMQVFVQKKQLIYMLRRQCTSLGCDNVTNGWEDSLSWYTTARNTEVSLSLAWQKREFHLMFLPPTEWISAEWYWFYLFVLHHLIYCIISCFYGVCFWSVCLPKEICQCTRVSFLLGWVSRVLGWFCFIGLCIYWSTLLRKKLYYK